jgi:hypothetical protein
MSILRGQNGSLRFLGADSKSDHNNAPNNRRGEPQQGASQGHPSGDRQPRWLDSMARYWFVLIPVIMLNGMLTIDRVLAQNHEKIFTVTLSEVALAALNRQDDDSRLSETFQAHWVTTNEDGNLEGRISAIDPDQAIAIPLEQLDVTLLQKGDEVRTAATGESGRFLLKDVEPGVYTIVASGRSGFLAYGVHVLPRLEGFDVSGLDSRLDAAPSGELEAKQEYYVSHFGIPADAHVVEELQIDAAAVPPKYDTLMRISQNYLPAATALAVRSDVDDLKAIKKATKIRGGFKFPLDEEGNLIGRIQPIATSSGELSKVSEMNVFLIQEDQEVARVAVEESGSFKIEDVEPGVYSIVAAGKDGFAALSLELVEGTLNGQDRVGAIGRQANAHYVSLGKSAPEPGPTFAMAYIVDGRDINKVVNEKLKDAFEQNQAQQLVQQGGGNFEQFGGQSYPSSSGGMYGSNSVPSGGSGGATGTVGGSRAGAGIAVAFAAAIGIGAAVTFSDSSSPSDPDSPSDNASVEVDF